jgi:hypothetical protein
MYCPGCAVPNVEGTKFCRACGTNLETVFLALASQNQGAEVRDEKTAPSTPLEKQGEGARNALQGGILLMAALLIGVALGLFSNKPDWIIIWTVFFGWMACWGVISLAFGLGAIVESKVLLRRTLLREADQALSPATPTAELLSTGDVEIVTYTPSPLSVTEHTTKSLGKQHPASKQTTGEK